MGINKTIKTSMREKWEDWMLEGDGLVNGAAKEPTQKLVAEWVWVAYNSIPNQTANNAWLKKDFEWFN